MYFITFTFIYPIFAELPTIDIYEGGMKTPRGGIFQNYVLCMTWFYSKIVEVLVSEMVVWVCVSVCVCMCVSTVQNEQDLRSIYHD